ncbi:hypothetical protein [Micromonospora sp. NBC_01796]|uniref:hypothetical protein n=1 Tax=Micromonospora sp. NBC_01796 TaxID=2975987 RepID=UPI002DDA60B1|nr:hypothetical protein [Micromonospora sp. NBC_01796]WSA82839.1 hypothetical protein OIE47_20570 [Micromonospora sp. NBC_01796]
MSTPDTRIRLGALAAAVAALMFLLYPAVRPWTDETTVAGATEAMSSGRWVASHLFAMIGFILLPLALLAVRSLVARTPGEALAAAGVVTTWIGAGLTLPYYGAEDFALNAIAGRSADGQPLDLLDLVDAVRYGPVAITTFGIGLVLLGVGAVLAAVAIWRSGLLPRATGIPLALGFALFLPQFYTPSAVRIGHGVLVAVGLAWLALTLWRQPAATRPAP